MKRWFGDVPWDVRVAGVTLVTAAEAVAGTDDREFEDRHDDGPENERDSPDWGGTAMLWLARCQLDQMRSLLSADDVVRLQGDDSATLAGDEAGDARLLREGLALHRCLTGSPAVVHHGFNVAGDITITYGLEIPPSPALGLRGSQTQEIEDSPVAVLRAAVEATLAAGRWSRSGPGERSVDGRGEGHA